MFIRSGNAFGDAGLVAVSAGIAGLTLLETLCVLQNYVGISGGLALAREAARLPALRVLRLLNFWDSEDAIDEPTKEAIRGMLPDVFVEGL